MAFELMIGLALQRDYELEFEENGIRETNYVITACALFSWLESRVILFPLCFEYDGFPLAVESEAKRRTKLQRQTGG